MRHSLSLQCWSVLFSGSILTSFVCSIWGRLSLPLPLPCHHRASRALAGVLGRRGHALEFVAARVCREEGARVLSTNVFLLDLDLIGICVQDQRRIEVIVEGLPVFHGAQLAITLLSPLRADGNLTNGVHGLMVQLWWLPDAARSGHIQSWWETVNVSSWLCLLGFPRQGEDPLHSRAVAHSCSLCLGCSDGGLFWHVLQPGRLHLRCWIVGATREHTAPPRRMLKFWLISARRHQLCRCQGFLTKKSLRLAQRAAQEHPVGVQFAQCEQRVVQAQKRLGALNENEPNWFPSWKRARHDCSGCESKLLGSGAEFNSASTTTKLSSRASTVAISHGTNAAERINWVHSKRGSKKVQDKWERSSRISGRRSTLSGTRDSLPRKRRPPWRGGREFSQFLEATSDGSHPHQWRSVS